MTTDAGEVGEEVSKAAIWMGRLGTFFKVLGAVGLVITIIAGIIELVEGAEQYVTPHRLSYQLRRPGAASANRPALSSPAGRRS